VQLEGLCADRTLQLEGQLSVELCELVHVERVGILPGPPQSLGLVSKVDGRACKTHEVGDVLHPVLLQLLHLVPLKAEQVGRVP
jgi:hypothetical protein